MTPKDVIAARQRGSILDSAAALGIKEAFIRSSRSCPDILFKISLLEENFKMNVLLLVQSTEDAALLKECSAGLARFAPDAIWLVHSPAVLVDMTAANAQTDSQILAINQAIRECIGREDFTGAENYKQQRHALTLQKATTATEGYKNMTPEQIEAGMTRVFGEFWAAKPAPKMSITQHTQHFERGEWIEMLNSMKGRWPAEMPAGGFVVAWPGQFLGVKSGVDSFYTTAVAAPLANAMPQTMAKVIEESEQPKKERKTPKGYLGSPRFKQLCSSGLDALGHIALSYKINPDGMNRMKLAHAIGKHEEANGLLEKASV